jgi:hypothetical protein
VAKALALAALGLPPATAGAQALGFVAAGQGTVEIRSASAAAFEAARIDREVQLGDVIRTGPASAAKIVLADDTILTVGESTELELTTYVLGPAATAEPSILRLLRGQIRAIIGESFGGPTRVEVHTPTAVVGVKGTAFDVYVLADAAPGLWTLACNVEGKLFVRATVPEDRAAGRSLLVEPEPGFCSQVFPDSAPEDAIPRPEWAPPPQTPSGALPSVAERLVPTDSPVAVDPLPAVGAGSEPDQDGKDGLLRPYLEDSIQTQTVLGDPLFGTPAPGGGVSETPGGGVSEP